MPEIKPFILERYFAQHEFTAPFPLSSSDCESLSTQDLLELCGTSSADLGNVWLGYTESLGHPALRDSISTLYETVKRDHVLVHAGAEEAIYNFAQTHLREGDQVVVQWPCYQSLSSVAESRGAKVLHWKPENEWAWDLQFVKDALRSKTRAVIVNLPHNPTGFLPSKDWFAELVNLCREHGTTLFVDEVYKGLEYSKEDRLPSVCDVYENGVSLGVMSKSFGLAGLRIGWVATKNKNIFEAMAHYKDYTTICSSAPSEFLSTIAIQNKEKLWKKNLDLIQTNLKFVDSLFADFPALSWKRPRAGCIAFPRLENAESSEHFCNRILEKSGVLLAPASCFNYGDKHFRIGFGRKNLPQAIEKFRSSI